MMRLKHPEQKELALLNGKIWTGNPQQLQAEAVLIKGERLFHVGTNEEIRHFVKPSTQVVDLGGQLVLPGFIDAHVHLSDGGFSLIEIDLRHAKNRNDFVQQIAAYAQKVSSGKWIKGGNYDHESWPDQKHPDRWLIDPVTKDNPVLVHRLDTHVALANSLALRIAGINKHTPDPEGGFIQREPQSGEPTGILKDTAIKMVSQHIPHPTEHDRLNAIRTALQHLAEMGVTSVHDMFAVNDFPYYQRLLQNEELTCRILAAMPLDSHLRHLHELGIRYHFGNPVLRIGSVKTFCDGSLGAGSALLFEPYSDDPTTSGLEMYSEEAFFELIEDAHKKGLQICAHAIGDKANRRTLNAYESALKQSETTGARHRIEHVQLIRPDDLPRFAQLQIVAVIQPSHCIDDMRWLEQRIGKERCRFAHPFQSLINANAHVAFSTDWPVEPLNPLLGIYAAVTREFEQGGPEGGWFPEEKMITEQALRCYTIEGAYAEHEETNKGTIEPGKLADLVVLDRDLFDIPEQDILKTKITMTIMNGNIVYER